MESHAPPAQPNGTRVQVAILAGPCLFPGCMGIHPGNGQTIEGPLYSPTRPEVADKILSARNDYHNPCPFSFSFTVNPQGGGLIPHERPVFCPSAVGGLPCHPVMLWFVFPPGDMTPKALGYPATMAGLAAQPMVIFILALFHIEEGDFHQPAITLSLEKRRFPR